MYVLPQGIQKKSPVQLKKKKKFAKEIEKVMLFLNS